MDIAVPENLITYDVAVSSAGEDRDLAEDIARSMKTSGLSVFYDKYDKANLWGKNLYEHLSSVYRDYSKFCLMITSENYANKQWTTLERRAAQSRAFKENSEYILPLKVDDTPIAGILDTVGYIDIRETSIEEVVELIREKVRSYNNENGIVAEIVKAEDVFNRAGIKLPNGKATSDKMMETKCPSCGTIQSLDEAPIELRGDETCYLCKNGCQVLLVVGSPREQAWRGRGYRLKDYVIRNASDVLMKIDSSSQPILIPASRAALMAHRPASD